MKRSAIRKRNPRRIAGLRAKQFGEKRDWTIRQPCAVTGERSNRTHPAHVRSRGAGGDSTDLVPLRWDVHRSFDCDSEERFLARWGRTKESVRVLAYVYEAEWQSERDTWKEDLGE